MFTIIINNLILTVITEIYLVYGTGYSVTFKKLNVEKTIFGVDTYMDTSENANFINLVKIPFGEYRQPGSLRLLIPFPAPPHGS